MNLYDDLGVPPDATAETIKRAYKRKAQKAHPDRGGKAEAFHAIQRAYDVLGDEQRRARYDSTGDTGTPPDPLGHARKAVGEMFIRCLDSSNIDYTDLIAAVRAKIDQDIFNTNSISSKLRQIIRKREQALKRLRYKAKGEGFVQQMIKGSIVQLQQGIRTNELEKERLYLMLKVLGEYEYQYDSNVQQCHPFSIRFP